MSSSLKNSSTETIDSVLFNEIYHEMPALCLLIDTKFNIISVNNFGSKQLGYVSDELIGRPVLSIYSDNDQQFIKNNLELMLKKSNADTSRWECTRIRKDNSHFWARDTARILPSKNKSNLHILLLSEDITETRYLINELEKQASSDSLTGLFNRNKFERHLEQAILSAQTNAQTHSLCFIDLDQFKVVNDVCGHMAGDELLRQISTIIKSEIRSHDVLGRLGGDEFGLLLLDTSIEESNPVVNKILNLILQFHFNWGKEVFNIGASIGMLAITQNSQSAEASLKMADTACFTAKEKGRKNIQVYNADDDNIHQRDQMQKFASRINYAFEKDRFILHYQKIIPLIETESEQRIEILVRMLSDEGELVYPGSFIPSAEYYGLATTLDLWVTKHSLAFFKQTSLSRNTVCNINLSGKTLGSSEFIQQATKLISECKNPKLTICFEVTETAAISNMAQAVSFIKHFKKLGCLFALDDFGSGFSSFAYLKTLPIDFLKLDGYFVRNILQEPKDMALVRAIHQVADVFGIKTIAEFVESKEIMTVLTGLGIDYGQGYHLHKPEPITLLND